MSNRVSNGVNNEAIIEALKDVREYVESDEASLDVKRALWGLDEAIERLRGQRDGEEEFGAKDTLEEFGAKSTLEEVQNLCYNCPGCVGCPMRGPSECRLSGLPYSWDLDFSLRFSDRELHWMRVMLSAVEDDEELWLGREDGGSLYWERSIVTGLSQKGVLPSKLLPGIRNGTRVNVREVLETEGLEDEEDGEDGED